MFKIKQFDSDLNIFDIYSLFKDNKNSILLDSSKKDKNLSKYSFIGLNSFLKFESFKNDVYIDDKLVSGIPFEVLEDIICKYKIDVNLDIPFISGAIGYISYDTFRILEDIKSGADSDIEIPDIRFIFYENIIIHDLESNEKFVTSRFDESSLDKILKIIKSGKKINKLPLGNKDTKFISNFKKEDYKKCVNKLKDYIVSGDVYIANMTQRFYCENDEESINIYNKLRNINKAPFSCFLNFDDFQIISSSPERFIQIVNKKAHTRPIKGTRPRGNNQEEDLKNKLALINSEKDKAELLMVVDLERNDFSKVCKPHSVKVTQLFHLEEYATVFHLVSNVEGILKDNVSSIKCIKECFPGGSITGTPKIRAMEIIEELEGLKRNIYTGCIGYFDFRGNCDFNIAIRTILKKDNKAYFGVGGGITYDSIDEDEYNETLDKAKALMDVLR